MSVVVSWTWALGHEIITTPIPYGPPTISNWSLNLDRTPSYLLCLARMPNDPFWSCPHAGHYTVTYSLCSFSHKICEMDTEM